MDVDLLVQRYPLLFHVAAAGSWPAIREHGLLPAARIVESAGLDADAAAAALLQPRRAAVRIDHPVLGAVELRDQSPLRSAILEARLDDGLTSADWLRMLNDRVFFWLHPQRVQRLLGARRARDREHDVITLDTASLVAEHRERVLLSPINSGAALWPSAPRRGAGTFRSIEDYPYAERRRGRSDADAVVELAVPGGVPDLHRHVVRVERRRGVTVVDALPL